MATSIAEAYAQMAECAGALQQEQGQLAALQAQPWLDRPQGLYCSQVTMRGGRWSGHEV